MVVATTTEGIKLLSNPLPGIYAKEGASGDLPSVGLLQGVGPPQIPQESILYSLLADSSPWQQAGYTAEASIMPLMLDDRSNLSSGHWISILGEPKEKQFTETARDVIASYQSSSARQLMAWNQGIIAFIPIDERVVYIAESFQVLSSAQLAPTVDPLDISGQLDGMRDLQDGRTEGKQPTSQWDKGYGKAPSGEGLDWLAARFKANYPADLPRPYLYPTSEGDVQAEWSLAAYGVSLGIDLAAHSAEWHCLNHYTGQSNEWRLDLNKKAAWKRLGVEVHRLGSDVESLKGMNEAIVRGERPARRFKSQADLRKFFEYTRWAAGSKPEPDWSESLRVLQESQLKGIINT